jgi:hypothetical protein
MFTARMGRGKSKWGVIKARDLMATSSHVFTFISRGLEADETFCPKIALSQMSNFTTGFHKPNRLVHFLYHR